MDEGNTIHVILRVLRKHNKSQYDTYSHQNVPIFQSVKEPGEFLLEIYKEELAPAAAADYFRLGYTSSIKTED